MIISVEKSRHINMESENFQSTEEKEERETMECPYKRFKFDSDEDDEPSFVTTVEESNEKNNSLGDNGGDQLENSKDKSEFNGVEEIDGSENGENV